MVRWVVVVWVWVVWVIGCTNVHHQNGDHAGQATATFHAISLCHYLDTHALTRSPSSHTATTPI